MCHAVLVLILLLHGQEFFGNDIKRFTVTKYGQHPVCRVGLKECLYLSFYPEGFFGVCRADNYKVFSLPERIGYGLRKVARDGEFILIPEDPVDLIVL